MSAQDYYSAVYALGAEQAGSITHWEEVLEKWASEYDEIEKKDEFMRRRHDPTWRPTADDMPSQAALMNLGGPAPRRDQAS